MKTILLVSTWVPHYRVSVYNYFWRRFRERGWDFRVASSGLQRENRLRVNFEHDEIPFSFGRYKRFINRIKPDVIIFHLRPKDVIYWYLIHWLKLKRIPFISWTKGGNLEKPNSRVHRLLHNYLHRLSDALVMYSSGQLDLVSPRDRYKVLVANNTTNFEDYPEVTETTESIKAEFGIPFNKTVLFAGSVGVHGDRKKVGHIVQVFRELRRNDVGLVLAGSGMTPAFIGSLNPNNSRYFGNVHDARNLQISKLFKASDVFVVPGHMGLGLNQAFYWGLPAITEAGLHPPEIQYLKHGRNGFIVRENDINELKEKILYLLDNDAVRKEFSRNAREDIHREASIENMYQGFLKAVEFTQVARGRSLTSNLAELKAN